MRAYIIRRLLLIIPTVLLVSFIIFFLVRAIPGDVIDAMAARYAGAAVPLDRAAIEHSLGLDVPVFTQYGRFLGVVPGADGSFNGLFQGYLGKSLLMEDTVVELIAARWPVTLELGILALIASQLIALPIGIYSALRQDTWGDYIARSFAIMCIAAPSFWLATLVVVFPSMWWGWSPPIFLIRFTEDPIGNLGMFIIPAIILGMVMSGTTMRMTRTMMLEVLRQDYVRTAWAKGLRERVVILRHALKNALIPVITIIGLQLPILIGGTVIMERIFCLPGMGNLIYLATLDRDYGIISGVMIVFAFGMVFINLVVDLTYGFLDPRVHYK